MIPKFEIVDASTGESGKPNVKVVIIDDDRFLGYIFEFADISFDHESDGIGVSYGLNIDIHKNYLPVSISDDQTKVIMETAQAILEKIMTDFVEAHNRGELDNLAEMV